MSQETKPLLAVTMGDPCGTGPELIIKAFRSSEVRAACRPVVIGDAAVLREATKIVGGSDRVTVVETAADATSEDSVNVIDLRNVDMSHFRRGEESAIGGAAAYASIKRSVELTLSGQTHAIVTSALNKAALHAAGHHYDGHTELLAELCGNPPVTMMLVADKLRVCHVSTHVSLREAIARVTPERILTVIRLARDGVQELGITAPHIAVAGLNPHAGEGGLFGDEEIRVIGPAVEQAKQLGFHVSGPYAGDTLFYRTYQGQFDCGIAMYHDQGHVAAKMLGIWLGVNVTLGLPIIRTSVEHGTDFANAGTGKGDPRSLVAALKLAATMATNRLRRTGSALQKP